MKNTKNLENQVMMLGKELDELKRLYARFSDGVRRELRNVQNWINVNNYRVQIDGLTSVVDSLSQLVIEKKVVTDVEFTARMSKLFDERNNITKIDPSAQERLADKEFSMLRFKCVDSDGKTLFAEPNYVLYEIGIGRLPCETLIAGLKPGATAKADVAFPENHSNKLLAGKNVSIELECDGWKRHNVVAQPDAPQGKVDKPMELKDGDIQ